MADNDGTRQRHFGLIWCTDHDWPTYQQALIDTFSEAGERWTVIDATKGELNRDWSSLDGFLVGGSEHSVNDSALTWLRTLFDLLARCADNATPVVGICFGAQALACALDGKVSPNPSGQFVFLTESMSLRPALTQWFDEHQYAMPRLVESHGDCINELPRSAVLLAESATAQHEIFTVGSTMIGVQGHPEISIAQVINEVLPVHCNAGLLNAEEASRSESQLKRNQPTIDGTVALCRAVLTRNLKPNCFVSSR